VTDHERNPKNAPGPFYVLKGECISCGAPPAEAPGLVTLGDDGCYFHKQPETPEEVNDAIRAMYVSCVEIHRYGGDDPVIRRRLAELGHAGLCDRPLEGHPVVLRNHARFSLVHGQRATDVAALLLSAFHKRWKKGICTRGVAGDSDQASFAFLDYPFSATRSFVVERVPPPVPAPRPTIYRDPATVDTWHVTEVDGRHPPISLHYLLVENGAVDIRWFSRDEWTAQAPGTELPY
jgi:hypothetical protein